MELLGFIYQDHQLMPYVRIGDQLELVAKLRDEKDKATRQAELRSLGYRIFRVAGVSPGCCGRGWCGGVR